MPFEVSIVIVKFPIVRIDKSISLSSKIQLIRSLVTSIFLYAGESWTLSAELQRKIPAIEMRCRRITSLRFAYGIDGLAGEEEEQANLVERLDKASTAYGMEISAKQHQWHQHRDQSEWTEA